jgi:hypothetical protein
LFVHRIEEMDVRAGESGRMRAGELLVHHARGPSVPARAGSCIGLAHEDLAAVRAQHLHAVGEVLALLAEHHAGSAASGWVSIALTKIECGTLAGAGTLL